MNRAWVNSKKNWNWSIAIQELEQELNNLEQNELNWNIFNWIGIERFGIELELKDLELNWYWIKINWASDVFVMLTVGSIAVQTMIFNGQEKLDNEAAGQTLPSN